MANSTNLEDESQDNYIEIREPTETALCVILGAAYLGLAKFCWQPLVSAQDWRLLINIEGFFVTIALLSLVIGLRPYLSPCSLQLSKRGIKYQGPYWPQRKSVNWEQVFRLYVSPELVVVLYHPKANSKGIWPLVVQSVYLAGKEKIADSFVRYSPVPPIILSSPSWVSRLLVMILFVIGIIWLVEILI